MIKKRSPQKEVADGIAYRAYEAYCVAMARSKRRPRPWSLLSKLEKDAWRDALAVAFLNASGCFEVAS